MTDPQPRVVDLRTHRPYVAPIDSARANSEPTDLYACLRNDPDTYALNEWVWIVAGGVAGVVMLTGFYLAGWLYG